MINNHIFIAPNLAAKTKGIKSFKHNRYINGKARTRLWLAVMQRIEFCNWCIEHGYTTVANYDPKSFSKWQLQTVVDPIEVFNHNLKLRQYNYPINYRLMKSYLLTVANRLAGINGSKLDHTFNTANPLTPYCFNSWQGLHYKHEYMVELCNYRNPFPI